MHAWEESLSWKNIVKRSLNDEIQVDLTEKENQESFYKHLRHALDNARDTTRTLLPAQAESDFIIRLSAKLPSPLQPLVWNAHLAPKSQDYLLDALTLPALHSLQQSRREVTELERIVEAKDHVIHRMLENLMSKGFTLHDIFPNVVLTGRGKQEASNKASYFGSYPGLRDFNMQEFRDAVREEAQSGPATKARLLESRLDCSLPTGWQAPSDWWHDVSNSLESPELSFVPDSHPNPTTFATKADTDDFEVRVLTRT